MYSEIQRGAKARISGFLKTRLPGTDIKAKLYKQSAEQQAHAKRAIFNNLCSDKFKGVGCCSAKKLE